LYIQFCCILVLSLHIAYFKKILLRIRSARYLTSVVCNDSSQAVFNSNNWMIQNLIDNLKLVRWVKRGDWVKTEKRGWITFDCYEDYLSYAFDPIALKFEEY